MTAIENAILCNISSYRVKDELKDLDNVKHNESTYYFEGDTTSEGYKGVQTNEAPVKFLLKNAKNEGRKIDYLYYLHTPEVILDEGVDTAEWGLTKKNFPDYVADEDCISVFDFFQKRIEEYCLENEIEIPQFEPIPFKKQDPTECLTSLTEALSKAFHVDIDITGGTRESSILMTLAIQIIKTRHDNKNEALGLIVYSDFDGKIRRQNETFDIVDLISATEAFTEYGRADKLAEFFHGSTSKEIANLCASMQEFSDALAMCQVEQIESKVTQVHERLNEAETALNALVEESIQNGNSSRYERAELLFCNLIPSLRSRFIPQEKHWFIETVRWCAKHQMIQQALCIYKEHLSQYLFDQDMVEEIPESGIGKFKGRARRERKNVITVAIPARNGYFLGRYKEKSGKEIAYIRIAQGKERAMVSILAWALYLNQVRNGVMHSSDKREEQPIKIAIRAFGIGESDHQNFEKTRANILAAINDLEGNEQISHEEWGNIFLGNPEKRRIAIGILREYSKEMSSDYFSIEDVNSWLENNERQEITKSWLESIAPIRQSLSRGNIFINKDNLITIEKRR